MIKVKKLTKTISNYSKEEIILRNVNFNVEKGEFVTIIGPSGGGKSTFLYSLAMLSKPTIGEVLINGTKINYDNEEFLDDYRKNNIGLVFQNSNLISSLNPVENLIIAMNSKCSNKEKIKRAKELLNKMGLKGKENSKIDDLSRGEAQRVSIARALVNNPKIILCDEPTGALDSRNSKDVIDILLDYQEENDVTLIIATHEMPLAGLGTRRFYLEDGELNELQRIF